MGNNVVGKLKILSYFCLRIFLEFLSHIYVSIKFYDEKHKSLPPITNLLLIEPATVLAQKIRFKKISSEAVVKAFIIRIKEINPIVNAVVDTRFTEAIEEARAADDFLRTTELNSQELEKLKPFLGVPITVKDSIKLKGLKQTAGLYARKDFVSTEDADVIELMKKAGAIFLCVTNIPEMCMFWETSNTIYGRTNNPYDTSKIAGGSSGGEGCLQSACGSSMGIGSDIGGSLRMPCFFNGIFCHKPTSGVVSNAGQEPPATGLLNSYLITGPMSKFACDLIPMYKVLASSNANLLQLDKKVNLKDLKIYYMEDDGGNVGITPVEKELVMAQRRILKHFETAYKIKPVKLALKQLKYDVPIYFAKLGQEKEAPTFASELALRKGEINVFREFLKLLVGRSKHTVAGVALAIIEKFNHVNTDNKILYGMCEQLKMELKTILGDDGVFLYPSHPTTAPYHSQPLFRPFNFIYTAILNVIQVPVTQCPLGLSSKGLPLGIQVVGNHFQDHLTLAVAQEIERAFGGWVNPSQVL